MSDLLIRGFDLVIYGMGSVFVFLSLLVGATMLMSALLRTAPEAAGQAPPQTAQIDPGTLAAVAAAVRAYRDRH
ncbi:MAG: OadG family protein [Pseudomonadales bacterium]|nr:OadG family protein [Pseudomonadales bacterium]